MKFEYLTGKRALGNAHPKDYTDWAEGLLCDGVVSENVAILAGLGLDKHPDSEEIKIYFNKCLADLDLELPNAKNSLLAYARILCEKIVNNEMSAKKGLNILDGFYSRSDYEAIYSIWDELSEDIWMVNDREGCIFNSGLTVENIDHFIRKVAKQFLQLTKMKLPDCFFYLCSCKKCGYIGESATERIDIPWIPEKIFRLIFKQGPTYRSVCVKCKEPYPNNMSDYEGRKQYLEAKC